MTPTILTARNLGDGRLPRRQGVTRGPRRHRRLFAMSYAVNGVGLNNEPQW